MSTSNKKPQRKWHEKFLYVVLNNFFRCLWLVYFGFRVFSSNRYPKEGPILICSNHQSHLDPILVGNSCSRYVSFVARESLFKNRIFGWLITALGAFPINRDAGLGGIKNTLKKLKQGEVVLIFPEGTRTPDGEIKEFKPGFCAIARRAKVPIVPVAIEGAYEAWPKSTRYPRPKRVKLKVGEPITVDEIQSLSDEQLTSKVQASVEQLQRDLKPRLDPEETPVETTRGTNS